MKILKRVDSQGETLMHGTHTDAVQVVLPNGNKTSLTAYLASSLAGKADASALASYVNSGSYNSSTHNIELKNGTTVLATISADPFIKDGMVSNVAIDNGNLVITFNTDAGKQPISIPLTDIFNPANYYTKSQVDTALGGKQDTISDLATIRSGAAAGATAYKECFDVSAYNSGETYASLSALLSDANLSTIIPTSVRKGGMSIKFVQSTDNNYVQYRLMSSSFSNNPNDWKEVGNEPTLFIGQGSTYVSVKTHLIQGRKYLFVLDNPNWERNNTGATLDQEILSVRNYYNSTVTYLLNIQRNQASVINKTYEITIPDNSDYITIGGRANDGVDVRFSFVDITNEEERFATSEEHIKKLVKPEGIYDFRKSLAVGSYIYTNGTSIFYARNADACILEYIPVLSESLVINKASDVSVRIYYYNASKTFVSYVDNVSGIVAIPHNVKFFRLNLDYTARVGENTIAYSDIREDDLTINFNPTQSTLDRVYDSTGIYEINIENGTSGNLSNANYVHPANIIKRQGVNSIRVVTDRPNSENCIYNYLFYEYGVSYGNAYAVTRSYPSLKLYESPSPISGNYHTIVNANCKGVSFAITEYNTTTSQLSPLREGDFVGYNVKLILEGETDEKVRELANNLDELSSEVEGMQTQLPQSTSIFYYNDEKEILDKLLNSKKLNKSGASLPLADTSGILNLLYFSDIHGDTVNISRIMEFKTKFANYISDAIHTGDSVYWNFSHDNPFDSVTGSGNAIMNVIGNHDVETSTTPYQYTITSEQAYNKFLASYIANWGVTYQQNKCYYYKDYQEAKIRLIVLDCMHYDTTQETWLENTLAAAKLLDSDNGYSVVIASHSYPQTGISVIECLFSTINYARTGHAWIYSDTAEPDTAGTVKLPESACNVVDSFITGGGKFICWLSGHVHLNFVATVNNHPNQLLFTIDCAGNYNNDRRDIDTDSARVIGTKTQDAFNIITFDTNSKVIKLFRVGGEYDLFYRHRTSLCINYDTKTIVSQY